VPSGAVEHEKGDAVASGVGLAGDDHEAVPDEAMADARGAGCRTLSPVAGETRAVMWSHSKR